MLNSYHRVKPIAGVVVARCADVLTGCKYGFNAVVPFSSKIVVNFSKS